MAKDVPLESLALEKQPKGAYKVSERTLESLGIKGKRRKKRCTNILK